MQYGNTMVFGIPIIEHEEPQIRRRHYRGKDKLPMDIVFLSHRTAALLVRLASF